MKEFPHGGRKHGETAELDFSANINPLGMPEAVRDAALQGVMRSAEYPDPNSTILRDKLSLRWNISPEMLVFGSGAAQALENIQFFQLFKGTFFQLVKFKFFLS